MLHEQISGYLDIKEKLIVWPETFLILSSSCQREGTLREEIALQGWRNSFSCPEVSTGYVSISKLEAIKRGHLLLSVFQANFMLSGKPCDLGVKFLQ